MRPIKPNARRRPLWRTVLLAVVAIVIGGAGTVAALAAEGDRLELGSGEPSWITRRAGLPFP